METIYRRPAEVFNRVYQGNKNIMTPEILGYGVIRVRVNGHGRFSLVFELSKGRGIVPGTSVFGVTIVRGYPDQIRTRRGHRGGAPKDGLSTCFSSKKKALEYTNRLIERLG